jgi:hypothetical protein
MASPRDKKQRNMSGGARFGGSTNYMTVGSDGAITQAGTNTNTMAGTTTLSGTTTVSGALTLSNTTAVNGVATFTAAPVLSGSGRSTRSVFIPALAFEYTSAASVSVAAYNSRFASLYFAPSASGTDLTIYGQFFAPADLDTTYGITPKVLWGMGAKGASGIADWEVDVECVGTGEVSSTASTADVTAGASGAASTVQTIFLSTLDTVGANVIASNDLVSLEFRLEGSNGLTTAGCPYFLGMAIDYKAKTI